MKYLDKILEKSDEYSFVSIQVFIQILQLRFEVFHQFLSFQFSAAAKKAVLGREEIGMKVNLLHLFVVGELRLLPQHGYLVPDELLDISVTAERSEGVARDLSPVGPFLDCCLFWDNDGDNTRF